MMMLKKIEDTIRIRIHLLGDIWVEEIIEKGYFYLDEKTKVQVHTHSTVPKGELFLMNLKEGRLKYGIDLGYDYSVVIGIGPQTKEKMVQKSFSV